MKSTLDICHATMPMPAFDLTSAQTQTAGSVLEKLAFDDVNF